MRSGSEAEFMVSNLDASNHRPALKLIINLTIKSMNKEQLKKLKELVKKVEYSRGTTEFEKWSLTLLTWLDGVLSGIKIK